MSSLMPIQRRTVALLTRATKQAPNARRTIITGLPRRLPTRASSSSSSSSSTPRCTTQPQTYSYTYTFTKTKQTPSPSPLSQHRQNSTKANDNSFKQWGFEDITSSLPTTNTNTTTKTPPSHPLKSLILIDVREPAELNATGIIPGAVSVPLASQPDALFLTPDEFETRFGFPKPGVEEEGTLSATDGNKTEGGKNEGQDNAPEIVFYCKAGVRARAAAQLAVQAGYDASRIGVYEGSWLDWADRGGRVERWEGED
ncbi:rhodanese-like domain-containing protein [Aspergillus homomorphus CBS 101889]|uniref:Rhodanese domain-containing protein n=1 Tax=Aspergillus homomorphus (strain CBS 101889) TaxID=1450537 RepID=A0A395HQG5_ASPHC|nr:hypothetical protein BO97DRAFT_395498 [Aspergillus homomorphus CBS 101889]RAL09846.1 hypothetical protein BO97DRAFT_395498 [Aspergillus homomorphus CBS 101889]